MASPERSSQPQLFLAENIFAAQYQNPDIKEHPKVFLKHPVQMEDVPPRQVREQARILNLLYSLRPNRGWGRALMGFTYEDPAHPASSLHTHIANRTLKIKPAFIPDNDRKAAIFQSYLPGQFPGWISSLLGGKIPPVR